MALSDFLSEGAAIPAGSAVKSLTTETVLPEWYTNYAMQLLANQKAVSERPYETAPMPRVAGFTPEQERGFGMTGTAATAYQPGLAAATSAMKTATAAPSTLSVAQPYFNKSAESTVANIGNYMNPYTDAVVNRIAELGGRNLRETLMPEIEGRYIRSGQLNFGPSGNAAGTPSGMLTDTARAIRDVSSDILGKQAEALRSGYSEAAGLSAADLTRLASLGSSAAGLHGADVDRAVTGAEKMAGLAAAEQELGLKGANAVTAVGAEKQALDQKNIDVALADFLRQQGYPQEQIDKALATYTALAGTMPKATTEQGIVPMGVPETPPSTAETIGGALTGLGSVLATLKKGP